MRPRIALRFIRATTAITLFIAVLFAAHAGAQTQLEGRALPPPLPYQSPQQTQGTVTCASSLCHGSIKAWKDSNVLQNEYITWSRTDKHARAYNVLLNARSQKIVKNLGLKQPAHESKICLDCHAHNVPEAQRGERFKLGDGVTCEGCHGPAESWINSHVEPGATHARNIEAGLYPTDDAVARARLCLSCHFGNKDKLVTHRIMAAGHPRMSFELDTFTEIAPRHFVLDQDYAERKKVWESSKVWAIGQALAVADTLDILLDDKRGRDGAFPELVLFDCHACHHPMSDKRWKAKTALGPSLSPGLVRLNDSNMLMLRAIAFALDPALGEQLGGQTRKLHRAVAGEGEVRAEALALKKLALEMVPKIEARPLDNNTVRRVAMRLIDEGAAGDYADYAAAEQVTMAIASVGSYLVKNGALRDVSAFNAQMRKVNATLASDERYLPAEFQAQLLPLRALLQK